MIANGAFHRSKLATNIVIKRVFIQSLQIIEKMALLLYVVAQSDKRPQYVVQELL